MISLVHKTLAVLILLFSVTALTGVATTAKALSSGDHPEACCGPSLPADNREEAPWESPCAAECFCASCLVLIQPLIHRPHHPLAATPGGFSVLPSPYPSDFTPSIEYPPEPI